MKDIFVARQAIYDRRLRVFAYELLYRDGRADRAVFPDALSATSQVMLNAFMEIGIDTLVGEHRAFINLPQNFFRNTPSIPFDHHQVVLELLEDLEVDAHLIAVVRDLKRQGYTIAIDDYLFEDKWEPLLDLVDIIKVEIPGLSEEQLRARVAGLKTRNVGLLAEKIETHAVFELCKSLGFNYFQGYFFSRPRIVQGRKLDDNHMVILRLLEKLNDPNAGVEEIEQLISQDAGLSFKVLRFINSAAMGLPRKVDSIQRAIVLMGLNRIRSWASLITLTGIRGKPTELMVMSLIRARLCESLLRETGRSAPETGFTIGLFSLLDAMLDQPLTVILKQVPLSEEVRAAITRLEGPGGEALRCAIAYENQDWDAIGYRGIGAEQLQDIYLDAIQQVSKSSLFEA